MKRGQYQRRTEIFGTKWLICAGNEQIKLRLLAVAEKKRFYHLHIQSFVYGSTVFHCDDLIS